MVKPAVRRTAATHLRTDYEISERRAARLLRLYRSTLCYRPAPDRSAEIRGRLRELATAYPRYGYRMLTDKLHQAGISANHKRVYRIYREEGLQLPRKRRKHLRSTKRAPLESAKRVNERWSMDFIHDQLANGRRFRILVVMDTFSRECLATEAAASIPGERVTRVLDRIIAERGCPKVIVSDNGPELTGRAMDCWASRRKVRLHFIEPGKPMQNGFVESLNGTLRTECLSANWFGEMCEARSVLATWRREYNEQRPHSRIGRIPPAVFARRSIDLQSPPAPFGRPIEGNHEVGFV